ncbi:MAG: CBS domain-containing protein [Actinomycetes bacterium]
MRTVADVMSTEVRTVDTTEVVGPVRDMLLGTGVHAVPVVDLAGVVAGIVTSWDLVEEWESNQGVVTVMSDRVRTTTAATPLPDAARQMRDAGVHHLVVVDDGGSIVGIVSSLDLLAELAHDVEQPPSPPAHVSAAVGDIVVIRGHAIGLRERRGRITEVRGPNGTPPYLVQWLDDPHDEPHEVLFFPGPDADVEHLAAH